MLTILLASTAGTELLASASSGAGYLRGLWESPDAQTLDRLRQVYLDLKVTSKRENPQDKSRSMADTRQRGKLASKQF